MRRHILPVILVAASALAGSAAADTRFLAFDARDRTTQALTRGVTLEVERGLFGAVAVRNLFSSTSRGSARFERGGPDAVRRALPAGASESGVYSIVQEGDGRGLSRALCPGAEESWLVIGRVKAGRPMTMQAVGRWSDGQYRHCVELNYDYRGEWATQQGNSPARDAPVAYGPN
ncbi:MULTISPECIES: hypothetical protein [unclassified Brevundimonas]|uniref:hypothetical protein n=1 Tax=unclassified Brevundimonas TaxID=2622653 RepID=UPI000CFBBF9D|nr:MULTISPECIES: hypothetical protein [unclassified Brevundimonas]PRA26656.1 hypothetical protein CQ024_12635 [Brevundimonas sp. MYb27]PQZ76321.1 hypothetical protein CQ026_14090 [Brevundimonas sp. MYb31]PRB12145.1 hypothetical protein CQ039_14890 [Brevundimonas sp. MYb52]PRB33048.1 hypothetical protein CQ035_14400 [Brevundimonas sp. MYb46]PRB45948.1 hypothetical protein CQ028_12165 [Brevundimonas sp. MYb33]